GVGVAGRNDGDLRRRLAAERRGDRGLDRRRIGRAELLLQEIRRDGGDQGVEIAGVEAIGDVGRGGDGVLRGRGFGRRGERRRGFGRNGGCGAFGHRRRGHLHFG